MPHNLGKAVGILLQFERASHELFEDLAAFYAPSECFDDVRRGELRRFRFARRHACHAAGVKNLQQLRRAVRRVCPTWDRYNYHRLGIREL